jgi:hypothetical protein
MSIEVDPMDEADDDRHDHLKYGFDGAQTLAELTASLRACAETLDARAAFGWRLDSPVDGGWAHLVCD